ncbi:MAG TPA: hypothetical protein VE152_08935 [Acidimicrobiales bacterium]|nr:hypothetical protein [Acidimicrobiales bacterium]
MSNTAYQSRVSIERVRGPLRYATVPAEDQRVAFGVHDEVAEHYKLAEGQYEPHATTLDYVVAAAAG